MNNKLGGKDRIDFIISYNNSSFFHHSKKESNYLTGMLKNNLI